jgi:threonine/homoserine/homoserine lactone efflux protein
MSRRASGEDATTPEGIVIADLIAYLSDPYVGLFWLAVAAVFVANEVYGHRQYRAPAQGMAHEAVYGSDEQRVDRQAASTVVTFRRRA